MPTNLTELRLALECLSKFRQARRDGDVEAYEEYKYNLEVYADIRTGSIRDKCIRALIEDQNLPAVRALPA